MNDFKITILGAEWIVKFGTEEEYPNLSEMDGYADPSTHQIVIDTMEKTEGHIGSKADMTAYKKQVIRHEIIHAFLYESGLEANSKASDSWAINEEMVDWFAIQSPKIFRLFYAWNLIYSTVE